MNLPSLSKMIAIESTDTGPGDIFPELAKSSILHTAIKHFGQLDASTGRVSHDGPQFGCAVGIGLSGRGTVSADAHHR
jgi:hypothetical protein